MAASLKLDGYRGSRQLFCIFTEISDAIEWARQERGECVSDYIEVDGKKYYEQSYLLLANANCKRKEQRITELEAVLTAHEEYCKSPETDREVAYNRFARLKYKVMPGLENREVGA